MPGQRILRLERPEPDVAVLWMDDPEESVNTLKREFIAEFEDVMAEIEGAAELQVLVFASAKPDSFIVGANLDMLKQLGSASDAMALSRVAQGLHDRVARLRPTSVAAIHGPCLGGGLELALAFDARVASQHRVTRIGLPEVRLGLLPGGGGTQRLPPLIGAERALDLLLTGRELSAERARRIGLVNETVPREILLEAAIKQARARRRRSTQSRKPLSAYVSWRRVREFALTGNPLGRRLLFTQARRRTLDQTRGNYPAPLRILEVVRAGAEQGFKTGLAREAEAFGELVMSPEAKQLIRIFFATTALKKDPGTGAETAKARQIHKIGVLGAGLMGAGIAYVTVAKTDTVVRLKDRDSRGLGHGLSYVNRLLDDRVKRRSITPLQRAQTLSRLTGTIDYTGLANTQLVIEAVFEQLTLKQRMLREIESITRDDTIFASNTSAIPIQDIAATSRRPDTVIGMHYFSPVEKMPLLEVVVTRDTAPWVVATCVKFGKRQGKTVIVVTDGPGFYTSRILTPYMNEAAHMLTEGVDIERIDQSLRRFGYPVGPMALLDEVGIDVADKVGRTMHEALGDRMQVPPGIDRLIADKRLGRKNGRGVYQYADTGQRSRLADDGVYQLLGVEPVNPMAERDIAERCALQMVNEAVRCLDEGIVRSPRDGDIGAVFGLGFPPFRGGPFRYVDDRGAKYVVSRLQQLTDRLGGRFAPAPLLEEHARTGSSFYPD